MKSIFIIVAILFIGCYLFLVKADWFCEIPQMEKQEKEEKEIVVSDELDISQKGIITWEVPREKWKFEEGKALIYYEFLTNKKNDPQISSEPVNFKFYAYSYLDDGTKVDRLILNSFYYTNDFSRTRFCLSGTCPLEGWFGAVRVYPQEKLFISLHFSSSKEDFEKIILKLQPTGPYRLAYLESMLFLRDVGLCISIILLIILGIILFRSQR